MAYPKVKPKSGMQGHNTSRWHKRDIIKEVCKKTRRDLDKAIIKEQEMYDDDQ